MTKIDRATPEDIYSVALNMRERDFEEFTAVNMANTREELAESLSRHYGSLDCMIAVRRGDKAVAVGGALEIRPNVVSLMFMATDDFSKVAIDTTKYIRNQLFPSLINVGIHRIECASLVGYDYTHRWLKMLGMTREIGVMRAFGKNGEDFSMFAKVA